MTGQNPLQRRFTARAARLGLLPSLLFTAACEGGSLGGIMGGPGPVQVGLLVPSGSGDPQVEQIAESLTLAARMGVKDLQSKDGDKYPITLRTYTTAGDANRAAAMAQQAVSEGANVILGPLYAQEAIAVGNAVAKSGVTVLSFSNNSDAASGNVFVLGNTFENISTRLASYARAQGHRRAMVINADTANETVARDAFVRAAGAAGLTVVGTASFPFSAEGVTNAVPGIIQQAEANGADILFLTSTTDGALPNLTAALTTQGMTLPTVQLAGLTRWDLPGSATALPGLQGGWFAIPDPGSVAQFNSRFVSANQKNPHPLAPLAYDGMIAIGYQAARAGAAGLKRNALIQAGTFAGATGAFRFLQDGTVRRGLAVATIRDHAVSILQQAPSTLDATGL